MNPVFPTRINAIVKARLRMLKSLLEESGQLDHAPTKGALRESYFVDFIRSVLPPALAVTGGFICDVLGHITPQIDLVVSDASTIPSIAFTGQIALVPVEAAIVGIEVKSQLRSQDLAQIQRQARAICSLRPIGETNMDGSHLLALFVFAFESALSEKRLNAWLRNTPLAIGVCVLDKFFIWKAPKGIETVESNDCQETLVFVSALLDSIVQAQEKRQPQNLHIWRRYIVGVDTDAAQPGA